MSKMILTNYSQTDLRNEMKEALKEAFGYELNIEAVGGCIGGMPFQHFNIKEPKKSKEKEPVEKYLTRGEVARLLKISLPTLHRYTKDGVLKSYRIGGKVRYKLNEVENSLKERNFSFPKKGGVQ